MVRSYNKDKKNVCTCFASDIYPIGSEYRNNELKTNSLLFSKPAIKSRKEPFIYLIWTWYTSFCALQVECVQRSAGSKHRTAWKYFNYGFFSGPYFPVFGLNTDIYGPNMGKYGPGKTLYLDTLVSQYTKASFKAS